MPQSAVMMGAGSYVEGNRVGVEIHCIYSTAEDTQWYYVIIRVNNERRTGRYFRTKTLNAAREKYDEITKAMLECATQIFERKQDSGPPDQLNQRFGNLEFEDQSA